VGEHVSFQQLSLGPQLLLQPFDHVGQPAECWVLEKERVCFDAVHL